MSVNFNDYVYGIGCRISNIHGESRFTGEEDGKSCRFSSENKYLVITKGGKKYEDTITAIAVDSEDRIIISDDTVLLKDVIFIGVYE